MEKEQTSYDAIVDAIVIGAGHNGLVAAAYLAKAGLKVIVLERRGIIGGCAATEEVFPGFSMNTGASDAGLFLPEIIADLRLESQGLRFVDCPAVMTALQPDGSRLTLWRDPSRSAAEIARFSSADAKKFPAYVNWVSRVSAILLEAMLQTPPSIPGFSMAELLPWIRTVLKARRLGKRDFMELMRLLPMPVSDFLDEWFESSLLKAALGWSGVIGSSLGPLSSGTTLIMLYQAVNAGEPGFRASRFVQGGVGALSQAIAEAARGLGAQIRTGAAVKRITLQGDRAAGVVLDTGEEIGASVILSSANPRHTFFDLVGAPNLEVRLVREVKNIRYRGSLARVNLALTGIPAFPGLESAHQDIDADVPYRGHILICPSLDYLERAYDAAKYGSMSPHPVLEITIPTLSDPSLARTGHTLSANVQYTPYKLDGDWDSQRDALGELVIRTLEEYAPGIRELILHKQVLTPLDLEREFGLAEGCIYHGQMALDQMFVMRPIPGYARYESPVGGLFLCGAGAHPGGGVSGAPGRNAARQVLTELHRAGKQTAGRA